MKTILCILVLSFPLFLLENFTKSNVVENYYSTVHLAEDYIISGDYENAKKSYKEAFNLITPLSVDLKNGLRVASILNNDTSFIVDYLPVYLRKLDVDIDSLLSQKTNKNHLAFMLHSLPFWNEIKHEFDSIKEGVDKSLLDQFDSLLNEDQKIRSQCYQKYGNFFYSNEEAIKLISTVDRKNLESLKRIYYELGSFSEEIIGVKGVFCIKTIVLHNSAWGRSDLDSILKVEVIKGHFYNRFYGELIDETKATNDKQQIPCYYCENEGAGYGNSYIIKSYHAYDSVLNARRREVYLEDYLISRQKIGWMFENRENNFSFGTIHMIGLSDEIKNKVMQRYKADNIPYLIFYK